MQDSTNIVTNEFGYSFQIDEELTNFVKQRQIRWDKTYPALEQYSVIKVTKSGKFQTFILYDDTSGEAIYDLGGFEQAVCYLEMLKLSKDCEKM